MPVGAHRRPPSAWKPVIPFLVILVVVPAIAWALTAFLARDHVDGGLLDRQSAQSQQSAPAPEEIPQSDVVVAPVLPEDDEPQNDSLQQTGEVNHDIPVEVLNASGISGFAGQKAQELTDSGFVNVTADNTSGWGTDTNTIFFGEESQDPTAQEVAKAVGIDNIIYDPEIATAGQIIVLLLHE